jgi:hypothetical protein
VLVEVGIKAGVKVPDRELNLAFGQVEVGLNWVIFRFRIVIFEFQPIIF